jgi:hypothetical protein
VEGVWYLALYETGITNVKSRSLRYVQAREAGETVDDLHISHAKNRRS